MSWDDDGSYEKSIKIIPQKVSLNLGAVGAEYIPDIRREIRMLLDKKEC